MAFDKTLPLITSSLKVSHPQILANWSALESALGQDHDFSTGGTQTGKHTVINLAVQASTPSATADYGQLYVKDVGGVAELHWQDENSNERQLTDEGHLTIGAMPTGGTWSLSSSLVVSSPAKSVIQMFVTDSDETDTASSLYVKHKTSATIADGFGAGVEVQVEDSTNAYSIGRLFFLREGANNSGSFNLSVRNSGSWILGLYCSHDGKLATGGETNPDVDPGGLCLYQGTNDGHILTMKSSDVDHGISDFAETDTYCKVKKVSSGYGGAAISGLTEDVTGIEIFGFAVASGNTDHNSSGIGRVNIYGYKTSGGSLTNADVDENILTVRTYKNSAVATIFIVTEAGDIYPMGNVEMQSGATVDGVDVSALKDDVDGFPDELKNLTTSEIQQLKNINAETISEAQWHYLGTLDQDLATTADVTFNTTSATTSIKAGQALRVAGTTSYATSSTEFRIYGYTDGSDTIPHFVSTQPPMSGTLSQNYHFPIYFNGTLYYMLLNKP